MLPIMALTNNKNIEHEDGEINIYKHLYEKYPILKIPGYWNTLEENLSRWTQSIKCSSSWYDFSKRIQENSYFYSKDNGCSLFEKGLNINDIDFYYKSIDSIKDKLKRKYLKDEYLTEDAFIANETGFPIPNLGDLIRTRMVVSYLDGVKFISDLIELCIESPTIEFKGKKEGYFACHVNFNEDVILSYNKHNTQTEIKIEIQIATHSATRVWELSHRLYEDERLSEEDYSWQWQFEHPKFLCHQLDTRYI